MKEQLNFDGKAGTTFTQLGTDAAQALTAANIVDARGAIITVEDNDIRYSFNTDAVQAANGPGHIAVAGATIVISSGNMVKNFSFINETTASVGVLQVTPLK